MICEAGDIAIVPFPFTDMAVAKPRPALVLSAQKANGESGNTIFAMITTAARSHWPTDVPLADAEASGLTAASLVRLKLFTLDNRLVARKIGALSPQDRKAVREILKDVVTV
ncbi:MAG: type II toxin-antitoxin system PemK/MazF family toxin [Rhizomicrobium sp.]|nr:type II toxin-antitoxin system PemK/MazF family toxin [Rhizomicrobium sp.]